MSEEERGSKERGSRPGWHSPSQGARAHQEARERQGSLLENCNNNPYLTQIIVVKVGQSDISKEFLKIMVSDPR